MPLIPYNETFLLSFSTVERPFTNWSAHRLAIWGQQFPTVEHAYQYKKFEGSDLAWAQHIQASKSPYEAQHLANQKSINRNSWDVIREVIMLELLKTKLEQHEDVRFALAETGNQIIVEAGNGQDTFWGVGKDGKGQNRLGKIWMHLRQDRMRI